jgi:hypothetical protein
VLSTIRVDQTQLVPVLVQVVQYIAWIVGALFGVLVAIPFAYGCARQALEIVREAIGDLRAPSPLSSEAAKKLSFLSLVIRCFLFALAVWCGLSGFDASGRLKGMLLAGAVTLWLLQGYVGHIVAKRIEAGP